MKARIPQLLLAALALAIPLSGCGGGSAGRGEGDSAADFGCDGSCAGQALSVDDVRLILQQGLAGAQKLGVAATFAVLDRVGNVLAVYAMDGAASTTRFDGQLSAVGGLEGAVVPSTLAAISKAGTGAYLSSQGNAFSTRTASQIIQENFNPGELNQPGGPLFGVQFSQLSCSDVTVRDRGAAGSLASGGKFNLGGGIGPRALPLGLSADPGGFPLYKQGDLVGGIGVEFDGVYGLDRNIQDIDTSPEEEVALYAAIGFFAPAERVASNIFAGGKSLRYSDVQPGELEQLDSPLPELDSTQIQVIPEFSTTSIRAGVVFGSLDSGIALTVRAGVPSASLVFSDGSPRYPTRAGLAVGAVAGLGVTEVDALLDSALLTAARARAAIRRPLDTAARVSIWVVDRQGNALGFTRSQDAPVFGIDVALQKARTAAFFSSPDAAAKLRAVGQRNQVGTFDDWTARLQNFVSASSLSDGIAYANRSVGNLARPFFVDGINGNPNGPLSLPFPGTTGASRSWSPFNTGLQLDLIFQRLLSPLGVPSAPQSLPDSCTDSSVLGKRLANGIQIFPGSVPLYRNGTLVGAIGISGDGIDQDDMIAFYGASRRGLDFAGHTDVGDAELGFNAPIGIRADTLELGPPNTRLRYVNCPEAPFIQSEEQNVCDGI
ncbi:MAG: heme-binding protein [Oligoflexia bacterium]|nr:heme-binding protein [Oligoflexia bacterium]